MKWVLVMLVATGVVASSGCTIPKKKSPDEFRLLSAAARRSLLSIDLGAAANKTAKQFRESVGAPEGSETRPEADLDTAYNSMLNLCSHTLAGFESRANALSYWKLAVAVVGSVAGSVAIPVLTAASATANKVWISGLGGVSGVANAGQQALNDAGLTPTAVLQTRATILSDWKSATSDYFDADKSFEQHKSAIAKGVVACTLYQLTTTPMGSADPQAAPPH